MPRPRIDLPKSAPDIWLTLSATLALAILAAITAKGYADIPTTIPFRFGTSGWPELYADRVQYWILPFVGSLIFALVQLLTRRVHRFPYPVRITPHNAAARYRIAIRLMQFLLTLLLLGLSYVQYYTLQVAAGNQPAPALMLAVLYLVVLVIGALHFSRQLYAPEKEVRVLQA